MFAGDCGKFPLSGNDPNRANFPQTPGGIHKKVDECWVVCLRLFYASRHPSYAAYWSDTKPIVGSETKNHASSATLPFHHCHGFRFRWIDIGVVGNPPFDGLREEEIRNKFFLKWRLSMVKSKAILN
jgi:hypothetical protein